MASSTERFREFYLAVEKHLDRESRTAVTQLCHASGLNSLDVCFLAMKLGLWTLAHSSDVLAVMYGKGHPESPSAPANELDAADVHQ